MVELVKHCYDTPAETVSVYSILFDAKILKSAIKKRLKFDELNNVKAKATDYDFHVNSPDIKLLFEYINLAVQIHVRRWYSGDREVPLELGDCWGMRYKSYDYTIRHSHYPASWAFVYYVQCPPGAPPLSYQYGKQWIDIPCQSGELVIFPGNAYHKVESTSFKGKRYCIAGNYYSQYRSLYSEMQNNANK